MSGSTQKSGLVAQGEPSVKLPGPPALSQGLLFVGYDVNGHTLLSVVRQAHHHPLVGLGLSTHIGQRSLYYLKGTAAVNMLYIIFVAALHR
jgi:hypothetical protein